LLYHKGLQSTAGVAAGETAEVTARVAARVTVRVAHMENLILRSAYVFTKT
jgi:hypothetical protein